MSEVSIAINRFGLGAKVDDNVADDAKRWLLDQLERFDVRPKSIANVRTSQMMVANLSSYYGRREVIRREIKSTRASPTEVRQQRELPDPLQMSPLVTKMRTAEQAARSDAQQTYAESVGARMNAALTTSTPFVERLTHFWANHFAVSADNFQMIGLTGSLEFEAIRPHVLGRFIDMLNAVEHHPAMLVYLDQAKSIGPQSPAGERLAAKGKSQSGLNENLARELMELHTLGVRTGYTQADVTELARALTGWSISGFNGKLIKLKPEKAGTVGTFLFSADAHEPGDRMIMGKRYPADGEAQAKAMLADFAASPATATHLATKLARHFGGDNPPPAMIQRLKEAYLVSGGDLPTVYHAIIASPEVWVDKPLKFKTPWEWVVSSYRAMGYNEVKAEQVIGLLNQLGQPTWKPKQPIGYDDLAGSWAGPDAVLRRVQAAERFASQAPQTDARVLAAQLFPRALAPRTAQAIARAESPTQALALLLVSPEMMRR